MCNPIDENQSETTSLMNICIKVLEKGKVESKGEKRSWKKQQGRK